MPSILQPGSLSLHCVQSSYLFLNITWSKLSWLFCRTPPLLSFRIFLETPLSIMYLIVNQHSWFVAGLKNFDLLHWLWNFLALLLLLSWFATSPAGLSLLEVPGAMPWHCTPLNQRICTGFIETVICQVMRLQIVAQYPVYISATYDSLQCFKCTVYNPNFSSESIPFGSIVVPHNTMQGVPW